MVLFLAACIDVGLVTQDKEAFETGKPPKDAGDSPSDTAKTGETGDTTSKETSPIETAGETSVETAPTETGESAPEETGETGETAVELEPPSIYGVCTGGYPYTSWVDTKTYEPELHVVGIYEPQTGRGGPVDVAVARTTPMVLALTSYEAVDWQIDLDAAHAVSEIVISAYNTATYTFVGAGTAPVSLVGWIGECGYEIPDMDPYSGCETPDLLVALERYTGLKSTSFQGCYAGGDFTVE